MHAPRTATGRRRAATVAASIVVALGATTLSAMPALADETTSVVSESLSSWYLGETRSAGHNVLVGAGLHVWTDPSDNGNQQSKAAAYRAISVPLADLGEPSIDFASYSGVRPSIQLGVDKDGNGTWDGYVVGEPWAYGDGNWWSSKSFGIASGAGYTSFGTLAQFSAANPDAVVTSFGYSLGSGVVGDAVISKISVANVDYTFRLPTTQPCTTTARALVSTEKSPRGWDFSQSGTGGSSTYVADGLRVATVAPQGSQSKAAGYVATSFALKDAGVPTMDYTSHSGERPGLQMTISLDGAWNGNLVYEPLFDRWWGTRAIPGVPAGPNPGYQKAFGTLDEILAGSQGHEIRVIAVGYSLGANAIGDATIHSITAGCTTYTFSAQKYPTAFEPITRADVATERNTRGWVAGGAGQVEYVDGGVKLSVPGDWAEAWIEHDYDGDLASLGDVVDFAASSEQFVGLHVLTAKGEITFEKDASYAGKWWSTSDFGVDSSWYPSFATLDDFVTANPGLQVSKVRLLYTNAVEASTVIASATFGGVTHAFTAAATSSISASAPAVRVGTAGELAVHVDGGASIPTGAVTVTGAWTASADLVAGRATLTVPSSLPAGSHVVTLSYTGDDATKPSTATMTVEVVKYVGLLAAVGGTVQQGDTFALPVVVMAPGAGSTAGHVTVTDGATVVGQGEIVDGQVTVPVSGLPLGTRTLDIAYAGNAQVAEATTTAQVVVTAKPVPPVVTYASYVFAPDATGSANKSGNLPVQVIVPGASAAGTVTVTEGARVLATATLTSGKASVTLPALTAGTHAVTVRFTPSTTSVAGSTTTAKLVVAKAAATIAATWPASATYGRSATVSVKVLAANGLKATGKVEIREGATVLKRVTLVNGAATAVLPKKLAAGSHRLTAVYLGTSQIASASASRTVKVAKAASKVTYVLGAQRSVLVKVSVAGVSETGTVRLVVDPVAKGAKTLTVAATLTGGRAKLVLPRIVPGAYKVSVTYLGTKDVRSSRSDVRTLNLR
ncbi:Ig-like domain-containing protein [Cellulomonas edaphi]|uniref:Ig-like domain-containing protein n=1 Tax=Cellulomonas edaphi TaxID=3053468 RepID=A0ABT7S5J4_9CELL|nr:Ig-like domain-containing protein [Cellulomons edaphi]MDM7830881.1 Ig-like domain-containing protein [Cellulomons edaphi]